MIHMESGLGEVLGKPIMKSIIGKSWSVMAIYKWSRYSIMRYTQREILLRVLIYFVNTQVIGSFGMKCFVRNWLLKIMIHWIHYGESNQFYPCRNKAFRLLCFLRGFVLAEFCRTDSEQFIKLTITDESKVSKFSNFYRRCLR